MFKRFFYQRSLVSNYTAIIFLTLLPAGCVQSDKQFLRREFSLPSSMKLVSFNSSPDNMGLSPREGLSITATFKFTPTEFAIYREKAKRDDRWKPLPVSRKFVIKMTGIRSSIESVNSYKARGEALPTPDSVDNPTEDKLYERWVKRLPLDVQNGLYQCQTSGSDIMHYPKVPCSSRSGDLHDFMFGVLDFEHQTLRVKINTRY